MSIEYTVSSTQPAKHRSECMIIGVFESQQLSGTAKVIDECSKKYLSSLLKRGDIVGKIGQSLLLQSVPGTQSQRVLLIGCGRKIDLDSAQYRKIITYSINQLKTINADVALNCLVELAVKNRDSYWNIRQIVEIYESQLYQFKRLKSGAESSSKKLSKLILSIANRSRLSLSKKAVSHATAIANGVFFARDLANLPPNVCNPTYLAKQANKLAKNTDIKTTIMNEKAMRKLGMNVLLSVSQGSREPAKLITMQYQGAAKSKKPFVLVGKGVTFDTGGISIKPSANMDEMKFDMCGAASVFGTLVAVTQLKLPINVIGVIPAVENMPGGGATRPGDIYTSMSGQTIEVLNTDAEGRLILCDALTYSKEFNPAAIIDIATLTGACVIALGKHASGLLSNHQPLAQALLDAGESSADRIWQLPLWDDYQQQLKSPFADMANIGGREAGTITAACFLSRFTKDMHWAHLDIAGTAWLSGNKKGATGRPVPLLTEYLLRQCS